MGTVSNFISFLYEKQRQVFVNSVSLRQFSCILEIKLYSASVGAQTYIFERVDEIIAFLYACIYIL